MSGDTVTGLGLQFTNDNKKCYAYSGIIAVNNTEKTLLNFSTNTEYINAIVQFNGGATGGGDNYVYRIKFNNVIIQEYVSNSNADDLYEELKIIIPPFTDVQCTAQNATDTSNNDQIVSLIGKVGMPQRVGDLDE